MPTALAPFSQCSAGMNDTTNSQPPVEPTVHVPYGIELWGLMALALLGD